MEIVVRIVFIILSITSICNLEHYSYNRLMVGVLNAKSGLKHIFAIGENHIFCQKISPGYEKTYEKRPNPSLCPDFVTIITFFI